MQRLLFADIWVDRALCRERSKAHQVSPASVVSLAALRHDRGPGFRDRRQRPNKETVVVVCVGGDGSGDFLLGAVTSGRRFDSGDLVVCDLLLDGLELGRAVLGVNWKEQERLLQTLGEVKQHSYRCPTDLGSNLFTTSKRGIDSSG